MNLKLWIYLIVLTPLDLVLLFTLMIKRKKDLDIPYGRVNRKLLKSKMLQKCISNGVRFHQAKVIKVIHEDSKSLLICNDGVTVQATVVLDATGFSRCLVQFDKPYNPGYQVAYGILAEVEEHPFDVDKMLFMDWRDSHLKLERRRGRRKRRGWGKVTGRRRGRRKEKRERGIDLIPEVIDLVPGIALSEMEATWMVTWVPHRQQT